MVSDDPGLHKQLFSVAHDTLGHFGSDKTYTSLRKSFHWPNLWQDLKSAYLLSCSNCARNKSSTAWPARPLHPLPIPEDHGNSVAINFIGPLPKEHSFNAIMTMTDHAGTDIQLIPTCTDLTAEWCASLFFNHWCCENRLPLDIVSDRDKLFLSCFWATLHKLVGVKLRMSTSFHLQMDGSSEHTNKTIN